MKDERRKLRGQQLRRRRKKRKLKVGNTATSLYVDLPNPSDPASLRVWFENYACLNAHEQAKLANRSVTTIRRWKQKAGLSTGIVICPPPSHGPKKTTIITKSEWDCKAWFNESYNIKKLGTSAIAKIIGRDIRYVRRRLERYGIKIRSLNEAMESNNDCCSREWLMKHYVDRKLSLRECAKMAGVVPYTISNWLAKFDIPARDLSEAAFWRLRKHDGDLKHTG